MDANNETPVETAKRMTLEAEAKRENAESVIEQIDSESFPGFVHVYVSHWEKGGNGDVGEALYEYRIRDKNFSLAYD